VRKNLQIEYLDSSMGAMEHANNATSVEALNRQKNIKFVKLDIRTNKITPILSVDAIDVLPGKHEIKFQVNIKTGIVTLFDIGESVKGDSQ